MASTYTSTVQLRAELNSTVDSIQSMVHHLGTVQDDLRNLQSELDRYHIESSVISQMSYTLKRCIRDNTQALQAAKSLRSKQQQLNWSLSAPNSQVATARQLAWDIQWISSSFFTAIKSIDQSLNDISVQAQSLQSPPKARSWWNKLVQWIKKIWRGSSGGLNYSGLMAAVAQTSASRDTLNGIMSVQPGLSYTTERVLRLLDEYMEMSSHVGQPQYVMYR